MTVYVEDRKMKKAVLLMALLAVTGIAGANMLANGDFETANPTGGALNWYHWSWSTGWSNHEVKAPSAGNGTLGVSCGNNWYDGGGGVFQTVAATAGTTYTLSVDSGADAWWLPTGEMAMIWLDAANAEISKSARFTVDPAVYGGTYDSQHPMANYVLVGTAPVGTAQVKVEFASRMPGGVGGSITFDNAVLVPEPATMIMLGLGSLFMARRKK
jgi:hypothetical protein